MSMTFRVLACAMVLLSGCDKVASELQGPSRVETRAVSCSHAGYCVACGLRFNGKFDCAPAFRPACPGKQSARARVSDVTTRFESGAIKQSQRVDVLERLGACT